MSRARSIRPYAGVFVLALGVVAGLFVASRLSRVLFEKQPQGHGAHMAAQLNVTLAPAAAQPIGGGGGEESLFQVVTSEGGVEAHREGKWISIQRGDLLTPSDVVRTVSGGRAVLKVGETTEIELRENVEIRLDRLSGTEASVDLRQGKLVARVARPGDNLVVTASDTRTSNQGPAHFIVMAAPDGAGAGAGKVAVATTEGSARFVSGNRTVTIPQGKSSRAERGGPPADPEQIPEDVILSVVWPEAEKHAVKVPIRGTAGASSIVTINGARVPVGADGRFATSLPLREGDNVVKVETEDLTGRRKSSSTTLVRQTARRPKLSAEPAELWNK